MYHVLGIELVAGETKAFMEFSLVMKKDINKCLTSVYTCKYVRECKPFCPGVVVKEI